jgi:hypothetical protein
MAEKAYSSIIDAFLDDREPNWEELDLEAEKDSGEVQQDRTHKFVDTEFEDEIAESAESHHTPIWGPHSANAPAREKQNREARLAQARAAAAEKQQAKEARERASEGPVTGSRYAGAEDFVNEMADDASVMLEKTYNIKKAPANAELEGKTVSDAEIKKYVRDLLNQGESPSKIAARLQKLAENQPFFNRQMSEEYLNQNAGLLGLAYLEPNHYMDSCPKSYERVKVRMGKVQAKSVKQIKACAGCQYFNKQSGQKTCNLYHLPIITTAAEAKAIVNKLTAGVPDGHKKATLVKIANKEHNHFREATKSDMIVRVSEQVTERSPEIARLGHQKKASSFQFDANTVEALHKKGHSIEKIYTAAARKIGSVQAGAAVKAFIAGLKRNGTKIALSQIDCTFLKQKLGVQNAIVGAEKCASCVYRQGMHCGLTGGTLLSFPGMEKQSNNHKIAEGAPTDGRSILAEYDLVGNFPIDAGDIDIKEPARLDVQVKSSFSLGDVE